MMNEKSVELICDLTQMELRDLENCEFPTLKDKFYYKSDVVSELKIARPAKSLYERVMRYFK